VRISTLAYVRRHAMGQVCPADLEVLAVLADADRSGTGRRIRLTAVQVAQERRKSVQWTKEQMARLLRDGRFLKREGWTYIIVGASDHDVDFCTHPQCIADSEESARLRRVDELAEQRRKRDAARKRMKRARGSGDVDPWVASG
jgi:hypothetical protein